MEDKEIKQLHKMYEESKKLVESSMGIPNEISSIRDEKERDFYLVIRDFFLQQKQKELIEKDVY